MARKSVFLIFTCIGLSALTIFLLVVFSNHANRKQNGFIRLFPPYLIGLGNKLDLKYNSYYIAGLSSGHIYLGNVKAIHHLLVTGYALADTQFVSLALPVEKNIAWSNIKTTIDSPAIYMVESLTPSFLNGNINTKSMETRTINPQKFIASTPLSAATLAVRVYDQTADQSFLTKMGSGFSPDNARTVTLERQMDGLFSTDGILCYDPVRSRLLYLYYYRNEFMLLDTSLTVLKRGKTIDTTSVAKLRLGKLSSGEKMLSVPGNLVNKRCSLWGDWLFIQSGLRANNESTDNFDKFHTIDVYELIGVTYKFSFHLPAYKGKALRDFKVYNRTLVAIYEDELLTFKLNFVEPKIQSPDPR